MVTRPPREVLEAELTRRLKEHDVMRECMPSILDLLRRVASQTPGDHATAAKICITEFNRKMLDAGLVVQHYGP